ncbi:MAG: glutamate--tRNA ligase [Conexivisphaerales archaeon]
MEEPARSVLIAALLNAIQHSGRADTKAVVARVLAEHAELRKDARLIANYAADAVAKVNSMSLQQQKDMLLSLKPSILQEEEKRREEARRREQEKKGLPPLPDADKYETVITRFAPNPDSVLHLGSTRAIILSHDYARLYNGRFILRFEDTDPRLKKSALPLYEYIREDLLWLSCKPDETYYQSDRLEIYYHYAEELIMLGGAYVCTCRPEEFRRYIAARRACPCRNLSVSENMKRWEKMLNGEYAEGEAVLRVKTDLNHPNPAVRDWPAMRIIDTKKHRHPRVGSRYRVWPLYNWSAGLDDHLMGITHIIRGQEHATNAVRQKYFYDYFGWRYPTAIHYGRLKIEGAELSKSKVEQGIREGRYKGYDDPRLATLRALRRRGIRPDAIRRIITEIGPKPVDVTISWENLYAYNRQIIDPEAPRHFAVFEPVRLEIAGIPTETINVELPLHPSKPELGKRVFSLKAEKSRLALWVSKQDVQLKDDGKDQTYLRLMGMLNVSVVKKGETYHCTYLSESLEEARRLQAKSIQWVPYDDYTNIIVIMNDASRREGLADKYILDERVDTVVQLERLFFARVDLIDRERNTVQLYFTCN